MVQCTTAAAVREHLRALADQVDAAYAEMASLRSNGVGNEFRVEMAERLETQERTNRGLMYRIFGEIADPPDEAWVEPAVADSLWARLRIPPKEIKRRMKVAARLRPRRQLTGPPAPPELPLVAAALKAGAIGEDHLRAICRAIDVLPSGVSDDDRAEVERSLVREARKNDAEIVKTAGRRIDEIFNPDGHYNEEDRARRRGLHLGPQGPDGMSRLDGWIDPETRSFVEVSTAAVRPGRHLPDGTLAKVEDDRTPEQRCHDGIKLGLKLGIASGGMGSHRGHPVTVIARTTLAELNQAAHAVHNPAIPMPTPARTGGDTALPMRDLIRMAADAIHYLAIFDDHTERPLYLARQARIATADQRIICYARDGGCTRPNCSEPGYHSEVYHSPDWDPDGATDADKLFFACGPDHARVTRGELITEVMPNGRLGWTDGTTELQINHVHHPDEFLQNTAPPGEADDGAKADRHTRSVSEAKPTNWAGGRYEAVAERIAAIAGEVVAAVDSRRPIHGTTVLDLACGTGSAALAAVAAGAGVTGVDLTPELIEIASNRPGGAEVNWVVADAADTGLPDAGFDAVTSNMGIIFVEPNSLVAEVARVLRPGGVFGFSSWIRDGAGSPFYNPIVQTLGQPPASGHSPDDWGDPAIVATRLATDFDDLAIEKRLYTWQFESVSSAMHFIGQESPMHVDLLGRLDEPQRGQLLTAFETALAECADDAGQVSFTSPYLIATARRR